MKTLVQGITRKQLVFIAIFAVAGFVALQIPIAQLKGSKVAFTAYDAFAPVAGAFVGSIPGAIAVLLMQLGNFFVHGANAQDMGTIVRFFPMIAAVLYFARKSKFTLIIPVLSIIAFLAHPIGREVWYFTLFWTIPLFAHLLRDRFILARALGATFTAHAVGGAAWIWLFALPAPVWISLIPIVAAERFLFALGITGSFILLNNILHIVESKTAIRFGLKIEEKYLLKRHGIAA